MPTYAYICKCGNEFTKWHSKMVSRNYEAEGECPACGVCAERVQTVPAARSPYAPFVDRNILPGGKPVWIDNRETQRRILKEHGLKIKEPDSKPYEEYQREKFRKYREFKMKHGTTKGTKVPERPKEAYPGLPPDPQLDIS